MKLMVLDGNSLANRAFYGIKLLSTRDGQYTNAIYGFLNILSGLLDEEQPDALCVTFDRKAPTFRHLAYAGYKANRRPMPEELRSQMPVLKDILSAMRVPRYELDGWEADDLMGTISRRCEAEGWRCVIVTGDKDALQLITEQTTVKLVTTRMGRTTTENLTPERFQERYGFAPPLLIDLKALMGDSSDNYPGVKGIGEKGASALIQKYGSLAHIYENLDQLDLKSAQRRRLEEGREDAKQSYELAAIRCDAPLEFHPADNLRQEPERGRLYRLFCALEFNRLIERFGLTPEEEPGEAAAQAQAAPAVSWTLPDSEEALSAVLAALPQAECVSLWALPDLSAVAVDAPARSGEEMGAVLVRDVLGAALYRAALERLFSADVRKQTHRCKELMNTLLGNGLCADGFVFDTALAAYLLNPTAGSYALPELYQSFCGAPLHADADRLHLPEEEQERERAEAELVRCARAVTALRGKLEPRLEEWGLTELLRTVELPLCPVLAEMERAGVQVDRDALERFGRTLTRGIEDTQRRVYEQAELEFNINSTKQLGEVLFDKLKLPAGKKTSRGYSTSAEVLDKLRGFHPVVDAVLEYRQLSKLNSTYVQGLTRVIGEDQRIHTSFQNTVTATGRLSSTEPNLQNIPVRTELGAEMRKMFIAAPGNVLVDADYSQIELRLLAHMADDANMIESFRSGGDIHAATAAQVYGVPPELVTKQMRSAAKAINFGIVYGMSAYSLSQDLHITVAQAKDYMEAYFANYAGVRRYLKEVVERAKAEGFAVTLLGRRRPLPELRSTNFNLRSFGERVAMNMPIQGTAADIIKLAMIRVQRRLKAEGLTGRLVLQVHDELIVECPEAEGPRVAALVQEEMEQVLELKVPLLAQAQIGHSWSDAH